MIPEPRGGFAVQSSSLHCRSGHRPETLPAIAYDGETFTPGEQFEAGSRAGRLVASNTVSVNQRLKSGLSLNCLNSSVWSASSSKMSRLIAWSCSRRAVGLSACCTAFWYVLYCATRLGSLRRSPTICYGLICKICGSEQRRSIGTADERLTTQASPRSSFFEGLPWSCLPPHQVLTRIFHKNGRHSLNQLIKLVFRQERFGEAKRGRPCPSLPQSSCDFLLSTA